MSAANFCTVTASTKRNPDLGSGRRGSPTANLTSLLITPLYPLSRESTSTLGINSPREFKECYHVPAPGAALPDVKEGDILTVAGVDYPVYWAGEWNDSAVPCLHIIAQEVKR